MMNSLLYSPIRTIFGNISFGFEKFDHIKLTIVGAGSFHIRPKLFKKCTDQVFCCWDNPFQEINVQIQVPMVAGIQNFFFYNGFELTKINDISRFRIRLTRYGYFYDIIMSVPVWEIAFPKSLAVPFLTLIWIMKPVCGIKMCSACYKRQCFYS